MPCPLSATSHLCWKEKGKCTSRPWCLNLCTCVLRWHTGAEWENAVIGTTPYTHLMQIPICCFVVDLCLARSVVLNRKQTQAWVKVNTTRSFLGIWMQLLRWFIVILPWQSERLILATFVREPTSLLPLSMQHNDSKYPQHWHWVYHGFKLHKALHLASPQIRADRVMGGMSVFTESLSCDWGASIWA